MYSFLQFRQFCTQLAFINKVFLQFLVHQRVSQEFHLGEKCVKRKTNIYDSYQVSTGFFVISLGELRRHYEASFLWILVNIQCDRWAERYTERWPIFSGKSWIQIFEKKSGAYGTYQAMDSSSPKKLVSQWTRLGSQARDIKHRLFTVAAQSNICKGQPRRQRQLVMNN